MFTTMIHLSQEMRRQNRLRQDKVWTIEYMYLFARQFNAGRSIRRRRIDRAPLWVKRVTWFVAII